MLLAQPGAGESSSFSLPFAFTLAWRLYRVIRSGGSDFKGGVVDEFVVFAGGFVNEIGGWNDGGACEIQVNICLHLLRLTTGGGLTGSSPWPVKTLSVVACTLPLLRCRSHMISLRFNCGNIWAICSTCAGVKRSPLFLDDDDGLPSGPSLGAEKKYR